MLRIGVPAGAELMLLFVTSCLFTQYRGFGPAAQAGFESARRVMQALFLPVVALSFAVSRCGGSELWRPSRRPGPSICLFGDRIA